MACRQSGQKQPCSKRPPFAVQEVAFCTVKGCLLRDERLPLAKPPAAARRGAGWGLPCGLPACAVAWHAGYLQKAPFPSCQRSILTFKQTCGSNPYVAILQTFPSFRFDKICSFCFTWNIGSSYRFMSTSIMFMSLGDTPGIRLACASVSGSIFSSFCRASVESCCISEYLKCPRIFMFSRRCILSATMRSRSM